MQTKPKTLKIRITKISEDFFEISFIRLNKKGHIIDGWERFIYQNDQFIFSDNERLPLLSKRMKVKESYLLEIFKNELDAVPNILNEKK